MKASALIVFLLIFCFTHCSNFYTAATVEYAPILPKSLNVSREEAIELMLSNLKQYDSFMAEAKQQGAQIIIFPEYGLYTPDYSRSREAILPFLEPIPNPESKTNPCLDCVNDPSLITLSHASCLARKHDMVLVINMGDIVQCKSNDVSCPPDGHYQYNTQVAFDEYGTLVQKYHKSNLFYERQFDKGDGAPKFFDSSFGVRFGMMICFDMIFNVPSHKLIYENNIKDILFSSWWVNYEPIVNAIQMQQAWSYYNQVNLIASNSGIGYSASGSGIYSSGKALTVYYNPSEKFISRLLVANVTKAQGTSAEHNPVRADRQGSTPPLVSFTSFIPVPGNVYNFTQTAGNITCDISCSISRTMASDELYAVFALSGYGFKLFPQDMCGLFKCGKTEEDCNRIIHELRDKKITPTKTVFEHFRLRILGEVKNKAIYPNIFGIDGQLYSDLGDEHMKAGWSKERDYYFVEGKSNGKALQSAVLFSVYYG